ILGLPTPIFSRMRRHLLQGRWCFDMIGLHPDAAVVNLSAQSLPEWPGTMLSAVTATLGRLARPA
ncbi:MAG TPA: hypothetical protein VMH30_03930, partial [Verrucomicrobiae bacterium]|nr:hypothetical protein [Verrucomicrobiae bacterium]